VSDVTLTDEQLEQLSEGEPVESDGISIEPVERPYEVKESVTGTGGFLHDIVNKMFTPEEQAEHIHAVGEHAGYVDFTTDEQIRLDEAFLEGYIPRTVIAAPDTADEDVLRVWSKSVDKNRLPFDVVVR